MYDMLNTIWPCSGLHMLQWNATAWPVEASTIL